MPASPTKKKTPPLPAVACRRGIPRTTQPGQVEVTADHIWRHHRPAGQSDRPPLTHVDDIVVIHPTARLAAGDLCGLIGEPRHIDGAACSSGVPYRSVTRARPPADSRELPRYRYRSERIGEVQTRRYNQGFLILLPHTLQRSRVVQGIQLHFHRRAPQRGHAVTGFTS